MTESRKMSAAEAVVALAVQPADITPVQSVKRAREFYRYLQPDNLVQPHLVRRGSTIEIYNEIVPNLSAALAPFCQLTALRTNSRKAMINVMDRDVMYFLAEAWRERAANGDQETYEFVEDPIMMACSSTPLKGRICEMTLDLEKEDKFHVPMFTISDLSKSEFAELGPVAGPPYYRFYAGTPITTSKGVHIGSLAVMDTQPRERLTQNEIAFLGTDRFPDNDIPRDESPGNRGSKGKTIGARALRRSSLVNDRSKMIASTE